MWTLLVSLLTLTQLVFSADYSPEALYQLGSRVRDEAARGAQPVVLFDLDDTLINSRDRTARILREFAAQEEIRSTFPGDIDALEAVTVRDVHYYLEETFSALAISNPELLKAANAYWAPRFFSNEYSVKDKPIKDAAQYVRWISRLGARVVYLTGRDEPRMGRGTRLNLKRNHFPADAEGARLLMKPTKEQDDTEFKKSAFASVAKLGHVVGVFENEPRNLNAMKTAFPEAQAVFLDTVHSRNPDVLLPGVAWVRDFTGR